MLLNLTLHPALITLAVLVAVVWYTAPTFIQAYYSIRAASLRRRLERRTHTRIVYAVGELSRSPMEDIVEAVREEIARAQPGRVPRTISIVLETDGGSCAVVERAMHALARYPGDIVAYVPRRAWSAGTQLATAASRIYLGDDAHLGGCDSWAKYDGDYLFSGHVLQAHEQQLDKQLVLARQMSVSVTNSIVNARQARGMRRVDAEALAKKLVEGELRHESPIFLETAAGIGLPVEHYDDADWRALATYRMLSLPEHAR